MKNIFLKKNYSEKMIQKTKQNYEHNVTKAFDRENLHSKFARKAVT